MNLVAPLKRHPFSVSMISPAVWLYHRFNHSLRDFSEQLVFREVLVSHETIRAWVIKFSAQFKDILKKQERKFPDTWHLDEMVIK